MANLETNKSNISRPPSAAQSQKDSSRVASAKSTRNEKELSSNEVTNSEIVGDQSLQPVLLTEVDVPETVTEQKSQAVTEEPAQSRPKSSSRSRPVSAKSAKSTKSRPVSSKESRKVSGRSAIPTLTEPHFEAPSVQLTIPDSTLDVGKALPPPKLSARLNTFAWNDSDQDTDLEIEQENTIDRDTSGRNAYLEACELLSVVPARYFVAHLSDKAIVMRHHGLGPSGTQAIGKALRNNISVERLDLTGNGMGDEGGVALAKVIRDNEYITEFVLADNMMGTLGSYPVINAAQNSNALRILDLSGNSIGDEAGVWLGALVELNRALTELRLSHNELSESALGALSAAVAGNDTLDVLDLSWNRIRATTTGLSGGVRGVQQFASALKENVRLKVLNLAWNGLGPEGGVAIADALLVNEALVEVDLTGNRLDSKAAQSLSRVFTSKNETLQVLKLGFNPIETPGSIALITQLNKSETSNVNKLHLVRVPVEFEFVRVCEELQRRKPGVEVLYGKAMRAGNSKDDLGKLGIDPDLRNRRAHPILLLKEHVLVNDFSIFDRLRELDTENKLAVTRDQLNSVFKAMKVNMAKPEFTELCSRLDKLHNGTVYYGDIMQQAVEQQATSK